MALIRNDVANTQLKSFGISAYEYQIDGEKVDLQDLLVAITEKRAVAVEAEVSPLKSRIRTRNTELEALGAVLAELSAVQAQYDTTKKDGKEKKTVNFLSAVQNSTGWSDADCKALLSKFGLPSSNTGNLPRSEVEKYVEKVKSSIDSLNNQVQMDTTRMQSLVDHRDQSFTDASELMKTVSDTRSTLIRDVM